MECQAFALVGSTADEEYGICPATGLGCPRTPCISLALNQDSYIPSIGSKFVVQSNFARKGSTYREDASERTRQYTTFSSKEHHIAHGGSVSQSPN